MYLLNLKCRFFKEYIWDRFRKKACIIIFPVRAIEMYRLRWNVWLIKNSEPYNSMTDTPILSAVFLSTHLFVFVALHIVIWCKHVVKWGQIWAEVYNYINRIVF